MIDPLNKRCKLIVGATIGELDPNLIISNAEDVTLEDEVIIYTSKLIHTKSFNETNFPLTIVFGIFSNPDVSVYEKFQMLTRTRLAQEIHIISTQRKDFELPSKWAYHQNHKYFSRYEPRFISVFQGPSKEKTFKAGSIITEAKYLKDTFCKININKETIEEFSGCLNYNKPIIEYMHAKTHGKFNLIIEKLTQSKEAKPINMKAVAKCNPGVLIDNDFETALVVDCLDKINKKLPSLDNPTTHLVNSEYKEFIKIFKEDYEKKKSERYNTKKEYPESYIKQQITKIINATNICNAEIEYDRKTRNRNIDTVEFIIKMNTQIKHK